MDKCTHEVRKQYWKNIISQCLQRPEGMSAKQWLENNGICEQSYYNWLKKIRQETYELATSQPVTPATTPVPSEVTFAEIPVCTPTNPKSNSFQADVTIDTGSVIIGISNSASKQLLTHVFEVINHAR